MVGRLDWLFSVWEGREEARRSYKAFNRPGHNADQDDESGCRMPGLDGKGVQDFVFDCPHLRPAPPKVKSSHRARV
jgi:hypothetical protein